MLDTVTSGEVVAEVKMVRARSSGAIVLVEGDKDLAVFEKLLDVCTVLPARGRSNALEAMGALESQLVGGVCCIVDADFDRVNPAARTSVNVLWTDKHDLEMMIVCSNAFERIVREYCSSSKVKKFVAANGGGRVSAIIVHRCLPLGLLRLASQKNDWNLKFKGVQFKSFLDARCLTVDSESLIDCVLQNSPNSPATKEEMREALNAEVADEWDAADICCGHDVCEVFGRGLRQALGSQVKQIGCGENVEKLLRLAFDRDDFARTELGQELKDWEVRNPDFPCQSTD